MGFHENLIQSFTNFKNKYLKASDGLVFKFTKDAATGKYGYQDKNGNFVPFRTTHTLTKFITAGTSTKTTDMGESHEYRYVSVAPTPSQSKTVTGARYAQTVTPDSGKLLSSVVVNKYPDASGTYGTITSNGTHDMGATNNYRYVGINVPNSYGNYATAVVYGPGANNDIRHPAVVGGTYILARFVLNGDTGSDYWGSWMYGCDILYTTGPINLHETGCSYRIALVRATLDTITVGGGGSGGSRREAWERIIRIA